MLIRLLLTLSACSRLTFAAPYPQNSATVQASNLDACPGYRAHNVVKTDSALTADLSLAGTACNVYSEDLQELKLVVEYQTSMY